MSGRAPWRRCSSSLHSIAITQIQCLSEAKSNGSRDSNDGSSESAAGRQPTILEAPLELVDAAVFARLDADAEIEKSPEN